MADPNVDPAPVMDIVPHDLIDVWEFVGDEERAEIFDRNHMDNHFGQRIRESRRFAIRRRRRAHPFLIQPIEDNPNAPIILQYALGMRCSPLH